MEPAEKIATLQARWAKIEQYRERMSLLRALTERVYRDVAELEARLMDAVQIGPREAAMADKKANQIVKVAEKSATVMREAEAADRLYQTAMADPEKVAETLDDPTFDEFLDAALKRIEKSQDYVLAQLSELQAIGAELDRLLNMKPIQS